MVKARGTALQTCRWVTYQQRHSSEAVGLGRRIRKRVSFLFERHRQPAGLQRRE